MRRRCARLVAFVFVTAFVATLVAQVASHSTKTRLIQTACRPRKRPGAKDRARIAELKSPGSPQFSSEDGSITLDRNADGHFYADVRINGNPVHMLIDTGASGIALSRDDARDGRARDLDRDERRRGRGRGRGGPRRVCEARQGRAGSAQRRGPGCGGAQQRPAVAARPKLPQPSSRACRSKATGWCCASCSVLANQHCAGLAEMLASASTYARYCAPLSGHLIKRTSLRMRVAAGLQAIARPA